MAQMDIKGPREVASTTVGDQSKAVWLNSTSKQSYHTRLWCSENSPLRFSLYNKKIVFWLTATSHWSQFYVIVQPLFSQNELQIKMQYY